MSGSSRDNTRILSRRTAITAFITWSAFVIAGFEVQDTAAWMFALSLMSASAVFVVMRIVTTTGLKRKQPTPQT
ncbi:MAG: hypothetical protein L0I80_04530 [Brevibacterium sp.]|uniref:hypothetical protein n=1 Tax=Brevibacterium sp. TaxID=1701 RepID=UPI00264A46D0|nr:hypothetical protein [Brevibacterium sp.]MDN5808282.1 hypothetical protein [Brevibacterium sp.]MDN5832712.1 hypothetical protein [Brevibacterium sp.]MDN5876254.1 hypothetical protein [Brevibacterium sp.]MDN5909637.1 hypothetical protein [Brevibacterium sp.]MDN6123123.1 hypothetical protein [Brevibacterium sp.]